MPMGQKVIDQVKKKRGDTDAHISLFLKVELKGGKDNCKLIAITFEKD